MSKPDTVQCTAFEGSRRIASGALTDVASQVKAAIDGGASGSVLIFDDGTAEPIEIDFRGSAEDVLRRIVPRGEYEAPTPSAAAAEADTLKRPGRPRLGVVGREVTLLPRHWDWLNGQPGGASVALRKLVDEARRANAGGDRKRKARETAYPFMAAMAGDYPGFEEASRALFAGEAARFEALIQAWPADLRDHAAKLAAGAF